MDLNEIIRVTEEYAKGQIAMGRTLELDDVSTTREKELYENFIKTVNSIDSTPSPCSSFSKMRRDKVLDGTLTTCQSLFGDVIFSDDFFKVLTNATIVTNDSSPYEGMCIYSLNPETKMPMNMKIKIPSLDISASVPAFTHESIHAILAFLDTDPIKKAHYVELLSILGEKAAIRYLFSQYPKLSRELKRLELCRLEAINRHTLEMPKVIEDLRFKMMACPENFSKRELEMLKRVCDSQEQYSQLLSNAYGIGYLYGNMLDYYAQDDSKTMQNKLMEMFNSGYTIPELLDYYGINASESKVYEQAEKSLKRIKK